MDNDRKARASKLSEIMYESSQKMRWESQALKSALTKACFILAEGNAEKTKQMFDKFFEEGLADAKADPKNDYSELIDLFREDLGE